MHVTASSKCLEIATTATSNVLISSSNSCSRSVTSATIALVTLSLILLTHTGSISTARTSTPKSSNVSASVLPKIPNPKIATCFGLLLMFTPPSQQVHPRLDI